MRVVVGGLAPPNPSSGLGGLLISRHYFRFFREQGSRMGVGDFNTRSGEFVTRAPFDATPQRSSWFFTTSIWADDNTVASVFVAFVASSTTPARGAGFGQTTVYSESTPLLRDGVSATTLE